MSTAHTTSILPYPERLKTQVRNYVGAHPGTTKNKLDSLSGKGGQFKASKTDVRRAVEELIDEKCLRIRPIFKEEKRALGVSQQVTEILEVM